MVTKQVLKLETLITQDGNELVIELLHFLMRGARTTAFTGAQGSGKRTLLMSVIEDIHPSLTIRTIDTALELNLRDIYPEKNIVSFQERNNITKQMAGVFITKDAYVSALGEVSTDAVAIQMIEDARIRSKFTLFAHHAGTAASLVGSIRNSLLKEGVLKDEVVAERLVAGVIEFNVHLKQDVNGNRFIERITQIIPVEVKQDDIENDFITRNIIEYRDGQYVAVHPVSDEKMADMKLQMSDENAMRFEELMKVQRWEAV